MRRLFPALLAIAACLTKPPAATLAAPDRDRIEVDIAAPKPTAIDRVVAAFVADSLQVSTANVAGVTARPLIMRIAMTDARQVTYTATVVATTDSTSRAVLMALDQELHPSGVDLSSTTANARQKPIKSRYRGPYVPYWQRLERIAARLSAATP
jgi:hypothetical protein